MAGTSNRKTKDPNADLDFGIGWGDWLTGAEMISTSTWIVPTGITGHDDSNDATSATIWLSGGQLGEVYTVTNRIVTSQGRTDERSLIISIANR